MDDVMLRADCVQCAGLCCVALAFDRGPLFAFDKPAGEACRHLSACGACVIHDERAARGFSGCEPYDCLGAGQRVTQMFAPLSWRDGAETARAMFEAFGAMRRVHELMLLLREAARLPMSKEQGARRVALLGELQAHGRSRQSLRVFDQGACAEAVRRYLAGLRECVADMRRMD